jgi:hypothetical protein
MIPKALVEELESAVNRTKSEEARSTTTSGSTRRIDILFYGMSCFDPLPDASGYRVLFPNGLHFQPTHICGVWVRDRIDLATVRWSGFWYPQLKNDFYLAEPRSLTITGLTRTPLDADAFDGHVINLQDADPAFTIARNPDAITEVVVDHGTLSAHVVNKNNMIVVKWTVTAAASATVRLNFGDDFIELPQNAKQVYLVNAGPGNSGEDWEHFRLYRKLSTEPEKPLEFPQASTSIATTLPHLDLIDPTFGYLEIMTPLIVCSSVQSRRLFAAPETSRREAEQP